jgi:hypothetical protein
LFLFNADRRLRDAGPPAAADLPNDGGSSRVSKSAIVRTTVQDPVAA